MDAGHDPNRTPPERSTTEVRLGSLEPRLPSALLRKDRLGAKLLIPLAVAIAGLTAYTIFTTWRTESRQLRRETARDVENTGRLMRQMIDDDALRLRSALGTFMHNEEFKRLFRARDRQALLEHGIPLFRHLSNEYRLTRFYFIEPDGTAFARLHRPDDYGQKVTHATVQKAIETGKPAWGIEVGKTAFALRVVKPYHDGEELLGYIEFAEDIDHILATLTGDGTHIMIAIRKEFLNRTTWQQIAASRAGALGSWDDLDDEAVSSTTFETLPPEVRPLLSRGSAERRPGQLVRVGDKTYGAGYSRMMDVLGRDVGHALILRDMTERVTVLKRTAWTQAIAGTAIAGALVVLAYAAMRRTMRTLAASRGTLKSHAARLGQALERERRVSDTLAAVLNEPVLEKHLQLLADSARRICRADMGVIALLESKTGRVGRVALSNLSSDKLPSGFQLEESPPFALMLKSEGVVRLDDVMAHPELAHNPERHLKLCALLGSALRDDSGVFGLFAVGQSEPRREFTQEHTNVFVTLAGLATVAIRRALTMEELRRAAQEAHDASDAARAARQAAEHQAAETATAYEALLATKQRLAIHIAILEAANRRTSLNETLCTIAEACVAELDFDSACVYVLDDKTDQLVMVCNRGHGEAFVEHMRCCPLKAPDRREDLRGRVLFLNDQDLSKRFADDPGFLAEGIRCSTSIPLAVGERFVGLLFLSSHARTEIAVQTRTIVIEIARSVQPAIANALQAEDIERFNRAAAGREDRVIEIKHEVNELLIELGREPRYAVTHDMARDT